MKQPLPSVSMAYALLLQEQHREISNDQSHDIAAFSARNYNESKGFKPAYNSSGKEIYDGGKSNFKKHLFCDHCKMSNHTMDKS